MKTVEEVRKLRLSELKAEFGSFAAINEKLGRIATDSTLSQIANASIGSKTGKPKTMGSEQARSIEVVLNKPRGWMDTDPDLLRSTQATVVTAQFDKVSIERALETLIQAASALAHEQRKVLSEDIALLTAVPDSYEMRERVLKVLREDSKEQPRAGNEKVG